MAVEVVYNVADEWLAELDEDRANGSVDRDLVRVTVRQVRRSTDPWVEVWVQAGYSTGGVAVRLEQRVGEFLSYQGDGGSGDRANEAADRLRVRAAELGLSVRAGRLVTVG